MTTYKKLISACLMTMVMMVANAQAPTNSPYTRYGFGQLSDQSFGNSQAMGGIAYGLRNGLQVNASNPASYSAVDSLTFIFDAGLSLQNTNFTEGNVKTNAKNSSVDYIAMHFRLAKGFGLAAGFLPYSSVGYNMNSTSAIPNSEDEYGNKTYQTLSYYGEGGLQQVFIGLGYNVLDNLSVGANLSYLYGDITCSTTTVLSNSNAFSSALTNKIEVSDYKLDLGLQYSLKLNDKHSLNLGAVYSYGHDINATGYKFTEKYSGNNVATQSIDTLKNAYAIPNTFGIGATYVYNKKLTVGVDYTLQKWGAVKYNQKEGYLTDRNKIAVGAEYLPNELSNNYLKRVRYRAGAYYSTPYAKIKNKEGQLVDGNTEYGVSFGFGLPLYKSKSILNISGQYVKVSPKIAGMLEENYLRINIGLTFNERWFMKWKVD